MWCTAGVRMTGQHQKANKKGGQVNLVVNNLDQEALKRFELAWPFRQHRCWPVSSEWCWVLNDLKMMLHKLFRIITGSLICWGLKVRFPNSKIESWKSLGFQSKHATFLGPICELKRLQFESVDFLEFKVLIQNDVWMLISIRELSIIIKGFANFIVWK